MRLKDKVVIITGSARGMGRVFALRSAREGASVSLWDVLDTSPVAEEIEQIGAKALPLKVDVSSEKETSEAAKKTAAHFGSIDILVNNAAVVGGTEKRHFEKNYENLTSEDWDKSLSVNIKGVYFCCKAVIPYMKKQGAGKIINIVSTTAFSGNPLFIPYTTSKGGVVTLTRCLATALGSFNITVNAISPGLVMTEKIIENFSREVAERIIHNVQLIKKPIQPEDIAGAVVFLASDDASMITGQILGVNAGECQL